jgi:hypothetical protein
MSYEIQFFNNKGGLCGSTQTLDFGDPELYTETGKLAEIAKEDLKLFPDAVTYVIKES